MENFVIAEVCNPVYIEDHAGKRITFKSRLYSGFIITVEGKIQFSFNGTTIVSDENTAVFLPKGLAYTNKCIENARSYVFNFNTTTKYKTATGLSSVPEKVAREAYEKMNELCLSPYTNGKMLVFREIYDLSSRLFANERPVSNGERLVEDALRFMNENYSETSLRISDVAQHCFISEIYLRKLFVDRRSTTPFKYLTSVRMKKAQLLCAEKIPVGDVARLVGYSDVYQFSRAYKRFFGTSPTSGR